MPCFSAFEKVKESVKDSLKRRLNCASLLSRPSWISTCLPLDERPVSQMVDDTTQIPDDLYQSLLHAGRQAKSTTSGQHRTHLQPNGRLVLRLTSMTKAQESQNLKFASLGEERQIGSFVKLDHLEKRTELNNLQGYISGWDESQQRFTVILEDGTRIALQEKNLKDPDKIESPFEAMDQFHKTCKKKAEEELKKLKPTVWHGDHNHNVTVDSWFSNFDLKWQHFGFEAEKKRNCGWDANTTCKKRLILSAPGKWPMIIILTLIFIHNRLRRFPPASRITWIW